MFAFDACANLFCQRQGVFGFRIIAFGSDEIRVFGRDDGAAAASSLHPQIINHLASTNRTRRRVLEKATSRTGTVRLRRHPLTFGLFHSLADLLWIIGMKRER